MLLFTALQKQHFRNIGVRPHKDYGQNKRKQEPSQIWRCIPDHREAGDYYVSEYWDRIHPESDWRAEEHIEREEGCSEEAEKEVASLEAKKIKADAKAAEEAKKAEAESVVKRLLASGMSADEILEKLK